MPLEKVLEQEAAKQFVGASPSEVRVGLGVDPPPFSLWQPEDSEHHQNFTGGSPLRCGATCSEKISPEQPFMNVVKAVPLSVTAELPALLTTVVDGPPPTPVHAPQPFARPFANVSDDGQGSLPTATAAGVVPVTHANLRMELDTLRDALEQVIRQTVEEAVSKVPPPSAHAPSAGLGPLIYPHMDGKGIASLEDFFESAAEAQAPIKKDSHPTLATGLQSTSEVESSIQTDPPQEHEVVTKARSRRSSFFTSASVQEALGKDAARKSHRFTEVNLSGMAQSLDQVPDDGLYDETVYDQDDGILPESWRPLVNSACFDFFTGFLIIANSTSIGVQADYMARHVTYEVPAHLRALELLFCVAFSLELALRLGVRGLKPFFLGSSRVGNTFDFCLVSLQVVEEVTNLIAGGGRVDLGVLTTVMRSLRLVRILRLARVMRLVRQLQNILAIMVDSWRQICWTLTLFALIIYIFGVYFTQLISDHMVGLADTEPEKLIQQQVLRDLFGSVGTSALTLFCIITGGLDWHVALDPLMNHVSPLLSIVLCGYIAFVIFAMMNNINGIFVDQALRNARKDDNVYLLQLAHQLFEKTDLDGSGEISWEEFQCSLSTRDMQVYFETLDLDITEAEALFRLVDIDNSGLIDGEEFVNGCFRLRGAAKAVEFATFVREYHANTAKILKHIELAEQSLLWIIQQIGSDRAWGMAERSANNEVLAIGDKREERSCSLAFGTSNPRSLLQPLVEADNVPLPHHDPGRPKPAQKICWYAPSKSFCSERSGSRTVSKESAAAAALRRSRGEHRDHRGAEGM